MSSNHLSRSDPDNSTNETIHAKQGYSEQFKKAGIYGSAGAHDREMDVQTLGIQPHVECWPFQVFNIHPDQPNAKSGMRWTEEEKTLPVTQLSSANLGYYCSSGG